MSKEFKYKRVLPWQDEQKSSSGGGNFLGFIFYAR
jgi:hypothetical protein